MKRVQFVRYGGPEHMSFGNYSLPALEPGRVRVRVKVAALNPLDWKIRRGAMRIVTGRKFPQGMGSDFAGVVEAVGAQVKDYRVGDEVFGTLEIKRQGAFAEWVDADARLIARKPAALSFSEAACLPIPSATAWAAIVDKAKVGRGSRVFIHGASGAVGRSAMQLALARGAEVVVASSERTRDQFSGLGLKAVCLYGDSAAFVANGPYDAVFDTLGSLPVAEGVALLNAHGCFLDINPTPGRIFRGLISRRYTMVFATAGFKNLAEISKAAADGKLRPSIGEQVPFGEALTAIRTAEQGERPVGRVVLMLS
ncbi:NAD(P)-dependent alcohol dehydrogenase [Pseudomonas sp. C11]|uniref:NAD(P)-dependent alcohol dehydrogenase n=1 Tax=Pseudomonas sp. C11 TaxID=3075550 RepID=UPI002AFDD8B6|nr:NAD(P)-dependent alcohol dehydrogenase [Pseudomonas sp. C11]